MASGFTLSLTGDRVVDARLASMGKKAKRNMPRKAMRKALAVGRKAARARAPKATGRLRKSIVTKVRIFRDGVMMGRLFVKSPFSSMAHLVEGGTAPRIVKKTGRFVGQAPAQPFMTPTYENMKKTTVALFRFELKQLIESAGRA